MMTKNEFETALRHLARNPQNIVFFEDNLKQYSLTNQHQDLFHTNYWNVVKFISACYDVAEAQGLFNSTGCVYDEIRKENVQ